MTTPRTQVGEERMNGNVENGQQQVEEGMYRRRRVWLTRENVGMNVREKTKMNNATNVKRSIASQQQGSVR